MAKYNLHIYSGLFLLAIGLASCKKLISVPIPDNELISSSVFLDSIPTQSAVNGMYSQFYNGPMGGSGYYSYYITLDPARLADETYAVSSTVDDFTNNSLLPGNGNVDELWNSSYASIYTANSIIQNAQGSTGISATLKTQITGEAKFIRALCYFYLVNYFGDVPLVLTTDVTGNGSLPRTAASAVYAQMVTDLTDAQNTLAADYSWSQGNRTRANTWAASALLARVYLYQGNWVGAEAAATRVINESSLFSLVPDPNNVFLKNSAESILSFYTNFDGFPYITEFTYLTGTVLPNYAMTSELLQAFEPGDSRSAKWIDSVTYGGTVYKFPYKYKNITTGANTEYQVCLRLGEQYLIRAEARMQQGNFSGAQSDLDMIRTRAGLAGTTAANTTTLTTAIAHERQVEMFYEWGDRWLNLKRTNTANTVLGAEKPGWVGTDTLYPIPQIAISTNPNLTQNAGY